MKTFGKILLGILAALLALVLAGILARYTFLKPQFDEWEAGLNRIGEWEQQYRAEHPDATQAEVDAAFRQGIADMEKWKADYKVQHPEATEAEVDTALEEGLQRLQ